MHRRLSHHMLSLALSLFGVAGPSMAIVAAEAGPEAIPWFKGMRGHLTPGTTPPGLMHRNSAAKKAKHRRRGWRR